VKYRILLVAIAAGSLAAAGTGLFEEQGDVGDTSKKGSVEYNASAGEYRITGGGANIWAAADAFYFVWKRMSGDMTVTADVHFDGASAVMHRKAVLMIRQGVAPDAPYADAALHGDGLTSLQFRPTAGAVTQEIRSTLNGPLRVRIERRGDQFTLYAGKPGEELKAWGPATVALTDPVYVGLGVCSHNDNNLETAVFSHVTFEK
jgi:TolB protein